MVVPGASRHSLDDESDEDGVDWPLVLHSQHFTHLAWVPADREGTADPDFSQAHPQSVELGSP